MSLTCHTADSRQKEDYLNTIWGKHFPQPQHSVSKLNIITDSNNLQDLVAMASTLSVLVQWYSESVVTENTNFVLV